MLKINPKDRITAEEALLHPYFSEEPKMNNDDFLTILQETHDFVLTKQYNKNLSLNNNGKQNENGNHKQANFLGNKRDRD